MDKDLRLIQPHSDFLESYYQACKETWGFVHNDYIIHNPDFYEQWCENIFEEYQKQKAGIGLPDGFVPSATFWVVTGKEYVGTVNIRLRLTEQLLDYGGNIGIVIRKSLRRKGYAYKALNLAVEVAREMKIFPIVMTCIDDNKSSLKLLSSLSYERTETDFAFADGVFCKVHRFFF
jgi:predicted acetyltransferase